MSGEVNLLQQTKTIKKERDKFLMLSIIVLAATVLIAVGMLIFNFYLKTVERAIVSDQIEQSNNIAQFQNKRVLYQSISERLTAIQDVASKNGVLAQRFTAISESIPEGVSVSSLDMNFSAIKMVLASSNLAQLNVFLEKNLKELPGTQRSEGLKRIQVDSTNILPGVYTASITFEYTEQK